MKYQYSLLENSQRYTLCFPTLWYRNPGGELLHTTIMTEYQLDGE